MYLCIFFFCALSGYYDKVFVMMETEDRTGNETCMHVCVCVCVQGGDKLTLALSPVVGVGPGGNPTSLNSGPTPVTVTHFSWGDTGQIEQRTLPSSMQQPTTNPFLGPQSPTSPHKSPVSSTNPFLNPFVSASASSGDEEKTEAKQHEPIENHQESNIENALQKENCTTPLHSPKVQSFRFILFFFFTS